jgi:hypothetical protein
MPEVTPPTDPQAGNVTDPQPPAGNNLPPEPQAGDGQETISLEEARKLRSESANLRKRLKELDAAHAELKTFKEQIEAAQLSETQKQELASKKLQEQFATLQKERDDLTSRYQEERINYAIQLQAVKQGLNPSAAVRLLNKDALEYDAAGNPTNLDKVFKATVEEYQMQPVGGVPTSGGATNPSRSQSSTPTPLTWDIISKMSAEEYRARRQEITQWMAANPAPR